MASRGYRFLFDFEKSDRSQVFFDPKQARGAKARRIAMAVVFVLMAWAVLFLGNAISLPDVIEELGFRWSLIQMRETETDENHFEHEHAEHPALVPPARAAAIAPDTCQNRSTPSSPIQRTRPDTVFFGHIPAELEWAPLSLESSCGALDVLVADWISIKPIDDDLTVSYADSSVREDVDAYRDSREIQPALVSTVTLDTGIDPDTLVTKLEGAQAANGIVEDILEAVVTVDVAGLCLDFKQLNENQLIALDKVFAQISAALRQNARRSCIILSPTQKIWENHDLMRHFDHVILKAFREPWVGSPPGPLADDAWFFDIAKRALTVNGPERLTIALGSFAVNWANRSALPTTLPFAESLRQIAQSEANLTFVPEVGNTFSSYRDKSGNSIKSWLLDAASFFNQTQTLRVLGVRNIGIWSLGREDPGIWKVLDEDLDPVDLALDLSVMNITNYVAYSGKGPFLRVKARPRFGFRDIEIDPQTGRIRDMVYHQIPRPYEIERYGGAASSKLVLTFDDGPDAEYTSAILDILKETGTPGAFFVVGARVMEEPDLLNRIIEEGHEVGAHSFSHPRMDQISRTRADLEHRMTDKLIAGYSGYRTLLYREPFLRAGGPIEASRVPSLELVQSAGGIIAGMDIVPKDWEGISADMIVDYVVHEVAKGEGGVILLHDGGRDRSATVAALPVIIRTLKAQGYEFTSLSDLLNVDRAELMPEVDSSWIVFDKLSFDVISLAMSGIEIVFWVVLGIGLIRMSTVLILAQFRRRQRHVSCTYLPKVSVVIPAHNEGKTIARCIRDVFASDYPNFDVIVIDDGSQDETFDETIEFSFNPRVRLFAQLNFGKWRALNAAIENTDSEIIVCIDADTQIHPEAIRHLTRHFADSHVGAVAGKVMVGNRENLLTRLQALEYITAQNFDRRAFNLLNGILVVPGSIGAWRVEAVLAAGSYRNDTMTEDADLTVSVNRAGYRVTYEEKAVAYTEAPRTIRQLYTQRLRWSFGMFQSAWKHKRAFWEGRAIGYLSIPDMLIYGYLFPLLAPLADVFVLVLLYRAFSGSWSGEVGEAISNTPTHLIWAYLILPLLDFIVAAYALKSDQSEKSLRLLWLFPFQRFFYRQLLYLSVYRSVLRAIGGGLAGWGKMRRTGQPYLKGSTT